MSFRLLLKEQTDRDFLAKYKDKFSSDMLTTIVQWFEPEDLMWVGKNLEAGSSESDVKDLLLLVRNFKRLQGILQTPELNLFDSPITLRKQIKSFEDSMLAGLKQEESYDTLVDNADYLLLKPKQKEVICKYFPSSIECQQEQVFDLIQSGKRDVFILYGKKTGKKFLFRFKPKSPVFSVLSGEETDNQEYNDITQISQVPGLNLLYDLMLAYLNKTSEYLENIDLEIFFEQNKTKEIVRQNKIRKLKIKSEAENRRLNDEWKLDSDCPYVGLLAHAVFQYLVEDQELTKANEEVEERKKEILNRIEILNQQYDDDPNVRYDLMDEIGDLEGELEEILDEYSDVYDIYPTNHSHYTLPIFACDKVSEEFAVGDQDDFETATKDYWEEYIRSEGIRIFPDKTLKNVIDEDLVISYFEDFYNDDLNNEPEAYFNEDQRELSDEQYQKIERARFNIEKVKVQIEKLISILEKTPTGPNYDSLEKRIEKLQDFERESEDFIQEVEENPDGEFPSELIDNKFEELIDDVRYDPRGKLRDWDMELDRFVDEEKLIEYLIESDGTEVLATQDGNVNEEKVLSNWYYVIKV